MVMSEMRVSMRLLSCLTLLVSAMPSALRSQAPAPTRKCTAAEWSSPRLLDLGAGSPFEISDPRIASGTRGELYILGRGPVIESPSGPYLELPFVAVTLDRSGKVTRLSKPPFGGEFYSPRGIVAGDGLHVFWAEPDSTAAAPPPRARYAHYLPAIKGIWTSTYDGGAWSAPSFVMARFQSIWRFSRGWARPDWSPEVGLAFAGLLRSRWTVSFLNLQGTPSGISDIDVGAIPQYMALISPAPSQLVLGYISNDRAISDDRSSVFAIRSTDGGLSWSAPVRIALSGQQPASDVAIVQSPDAVLHAVWERNTSGETFGAQSIGYSVSRDLGKSWSAPEYWDTGETYLNLKVVADGGGGIHVVYQATLPDGIRPALVYTSRTATSQWQKPVRIFGDTVSARAPELAKAASGNVVLLLSKLIGMNGQYPKFASAVSYLHAGRECAPTPKSLVNSAPIVGIDVEAKHL